MKTIFTCIFTTLIFTQIATSQTNLEVYGNGLFTSPSSTNIDIKNIDSSTNALVRFGDNNMLKSSIGFSGNSNAFKISMGNTLGRNDFTISPLGKIGINSMPTVHRINLLHNSTSGVDGSTHLLLSEKGSSDFARLRFNNEDENGFWTLAARGTDSEALMNFHYNDGLNNANVMSLDGDLFRVGIHKTEPEAYLHIKQQTAGVDALVFENDDQTGGEKWGFRVGDNDILIYFEGGIRGSFNSDDGVYNNFPPPALHTSEHKFLRLDDGVLKTILKLNPQKRVSLTSDKESIGFDPLEVEKINPNWIVRSEDHELININYQQFTVLAIKSIQEQQNIIDNQGKHLDDLELKNKDLSLRITNLEKSLFNK